MWTPATVSHFHPSPNFVGNGGAYPGGPMSLLVTSSLGPTFAATVEPTRVDPSHCQSLPT
jgi:hypothetical protein